jgi:hypothetical protein
MVDGTESVSPRDEADPDQQRGPANGVDDAHVARPGGHLRGNNDAQASAHEEERAVGVGHHRRGGKDGPSPRGSKSSTVRSRVRHAAH